MIQEVQKSNMLILKQAQKSIDQEIDSLQSNVMQAALNRSLNEVLYMSSQNTYDNYELIQDSMAYLSAFKANNNNISDIWLYIKKTDIVLGTGGKYQHSLFFSDVCKYKEEIDWNHLFAASGFHCIGRKTLYRGTYEFPVVVFTESLPFIDRYPKGMLVVNMNKSLFDKEMSNYNNDKIIFNYVVDNQGNILYTNEGYYADFEELPSIQTAVHSLLSEMNDAENTMDLVVEGSPFTIQYVQSASLNWKYISVIPTGYIKEGVNQIRKVTLLVAFASILLSIILTLYIINDLYKPINKILNYINIIRDKKTVINRSGSGNEFTLINSIIDYVYKENQTLQDNFERNKPLLQDKYIYDIINGKINGDHEKAGPEIGIEFPYPYFQIIVYELAEDTPHNLKKYRRLFKENTKDMREIARQTLGSQCKCYFLDKDDQTIISLLNAPKSFYELSGINDYLEKVQHYFAEKCNLSYVIGIGQSYEGIQNCYQSFIDALATIKYQIVKGHNSVIYIDEVRNSVSAVISYPLEQETRLITITKSGNWKSVIEILESILEENLGKKELSLEMVDNLFHALANTAVRTIFEMRLTNKQVLPDSQNIYKEMEQKKSIDEKKEYIIAIFKTITLFASEKNHGQQSHILEKINIYLEENYRNEISLDTVAEFVNLSTSYLSFIFKENSGLNFVDYVNQFRLKKAKELLKNSSYNISQIAELSGYSSANSFSKVFKKYNGISPGQYRKL